MIISRYLFFLAALFSSVIANAQNLSVARQITALPDAEDLRYMVAWVIGYVSGDPDVTIRPMTAEDYANLDARKAQQQQL